MPANFDREPAKIYAFASRGRLSLSTSRKGAEPASHLASLHNSKTVFGDGWYHDAAIAEADLARKR